MKENSLADNKNITPELSDNLRAKIEELWLRAIRFYTFNTPLAKGKHRAYMTAMKFCRYAPAPTIVPTKDGRKISVDFATGMHTTVFFLGEYEKAITNIVKSLLQSGDICLDVGANFGWYATLFQQAAGESGEVHAFEPMPSSFRQLEMNYELMGKPKNVFINNLALGDQPGELNINLFEGEPTGHASLSDQGRDDAISFKCQVITLDSYLEEKEIGDVNFVKVDIEGAELMFLRGAERLFKQKVPPIWLMEMALKQTKNFGYTPNDLIKFMSERADYDFYAVDEIKNKLNKINGFAPDDIGANVICLPRGFYQERFNF